jgi:ABC-2 type transport system permease protein
MEIVILKTTAVGPGFRYSLINQGFDVVELNANAAIPAEVSILLIADPRSTLTTTEQVNIQAFVNRGGNMFIAGEPGKQEVFESIIGLFRH